MCVPCLRTHSWVREAQTLSAQICSSLDKSSNHRFLSSFTVTLVANVLSDIRPRQPQAKQAELHDLPSYSDSEFCLILLPSLEQKVVALSAVEAQWALTSSEHWYWAHLLSPSWTYSWEQWPCHSTTSSLRIRRCLPPLRTSSYWLFQEFQVALPLPSALQALVTREMTQVLEPWMGSQGTFLVLYRPITGQEQMAFPPNFFYLHQNWV